MGFDAVVGVCRRREGFTRVCQLAAADGERRPVTVTRCPSERRIAGWECEQ